MKGKRFVPTDGQLQWLRSNFADTPNADCAAALHISPAALGRLARGMGLRKSGEYRRATWFGKGYDPRRNPAWRQAREAGWEKNREAIAADQRRLLFGLPQRTRRKLGRQSAAKASYRYNMRQKGYVEVTGEKNVMRYPSEEMRKPRAESHAVRHGIKILPLAEGA